MPIGDASNAIERTATEDATDRELVQRVRADDVHALRLLMHRHWTALVAAVAVTTQSKDLASDAVQEAFMRLWDARETLDPTRNIKGFLYLTARRRALTLLQHERVHARLASTLSQDLAYTVAVVQNAGEQTVDADELDVQIVAAIQALSPRCREIFILSRQANLSYAEIAEALGISVLTVRNQMSIALQRITTRIVQWQAGDAPPEGTSGP